MRVLAYLCCIFGASVVGISMAAVIGAISVPVKMAYYSGCKGFLKWVPWLCALGAVWGSAGFFLPEITMALPMWVGMIMMVCMGISLSMTAVSLAEMMDVFTGPFHFVRLSEFRWLTFFIAVGKAAFCAMQLLGGR